MEIGAPEPSGNILMLAIFLATSSPAAAAFVAKTPPIEPPEPKLTSIAIGTADLSAQSLPLGYVTSWPLWMASAEDSGGVERLSTEGDEGGWCNPLAFEQLWLPTDLPLPTGQFALGCVLKDAVPRYFFPCLQTSITTPSDKAQEWHNRGLNSVPMAKTWLPFGEVPVESLRLSCYRSALSGQGGDDDEEEASDDEQTTAEWEQVLPLTGVSKAVDAIFEIVADAPDELGDGFAYLVVPLEDCALPPSAIAPGQRLRLFLSDVDATPTALDPEDRESWVWNRGEVDLEIYNVAAGSESEFLPAAYEPLYSAFPRL